MTLVKVSDSALAAGADHVDRELAQLAMLRLAHPRASYELSADHSDEVLHLAKWRRIPIVNEPRNETVDIRVLWNGRLRVSVVVACHNYGHYLDEAIGSVLAQTYLPDEIILSDDASTDDSPEVMRYYEALRNDVVRLNLNDTNMGITAHFNKVVRLTTGDLIMILGADNRLPVNYVEEMIRQFLCNDEVGIAYSDFALFGGRAKDDFDRLDAGFRGRKLPHGTFLSEFPHYAPESKALLSAGCNFIHGSSMYRKSLWERAAGYASRETGPEDFGLFQAILSLGADAVKVERTVLEYRQHSVEQANHQFAFFGELQRLREEVRALRAQRQELTLHISTISQSYSEVLGSRSFKLGRALLRPISKLRNGLASLRRELRELRGWRRTAAQRLKVVAVVSYRFDEDHLDDLKRNLEGFVDEIILNQDEAGELLKNEGPYRERLVRAAERAGADYVVVVDPDERFEVATARRLRRLMWRYRGERIFFEFNLRELYSPGKYRVDGIWGEKRKIAIFPAFSDNVFSQERLHSLRQPLNPEYRSIRTGLNIYHLKHIDPALRRNRRDLYTALDPNADLNHVGYDYLDDLTGMRLRKIPFWRRYRPQYREYDTDEAIFEVPRHVECCR